MLHDEESNRVYSLIKSRNICLYLDKESFNECYDKVLHALGDRRGTLDSEQLVSMIAAHYNAYKHVLYLQKRDRVYELYKASCKNRSTEILDKEAFTEHFNEVILAGQQSSNENERHPEKMVDVETQELENRHVVGMPATSASVSSSSSKQNHDKIKKAEEQDHDEDEDEDDQQPAEEKKKKKLILRKLNLRNNSTKWVVHSEDSDL